jgi:hypothetical protein
MTMPEGLPHRDLLALSVFLAAGLVGWGLVGVLIAMVLS